MLTITFLSHPHSILIIHCPLISPSDTFQAFVDNLGYDPRSALCSKITIKLKLQFLVTPGTFQVLKSHVGLVATILDSTEQNILITAETSIGQCRLRPTVSQMLGIQTLLPH